MICSEPIFEESKTVEYESGGGNEVNKLHRSSVSAYLPLSYQTEHKILRCIEERAATFQGHIPITNMENLQVVKYIPFLQKATETFFPGTEKVSFFDNISTGLTRRKIKLWVKEETEQLPSSSTFLYNVKEAQPSSPKFHVQPRENGVIF